MELLFLSIGLASGVLIGASVTYLVTLLREKRRKNVSVTSGALEESILNFNKAVTVLESNLRASSEGQFTYFHYLAFLDSQKPFNSPSTPDDDGDEPPLAGVPARPKK